VLAVLCTAQSPDDPLRGLTVTDVPEPDVPEGWVRVRMRAAAINHKDLWALKGKSLPPEKLPRVLGSDGAGVLDDGREVVVHSVLASPGWRGDETLDPRRSLLSDDHDGTLAERFLAPLDNVLPKPADLSWEEAACLPTAWLTAYRMLFVQGRARPGQIVLVQGAGGGVSSAAIAMARAAGCLVWATSRDAAKRAGALRNGAHEAFEIGARLPQRVDVVIETVGEATWPHSTRSLRPGGTIVVAGATTGPAPSADLDRVSFLQLRVLGSTMGTREELAELLRFCSASGVRPQISDSRPLHEARQSFERFARGDFSGKLVLTSDAG
jgi:NADPH:quinone reductase-like Zn-dependent oxidoreductase